MENDGVFTKNRTDFVKKDLQVVGECVILNIGSSVVSRGFGWLKMFATRVANDPFLRGSSFNWTR